MAIHRGVNYSADFYFFIFCFRNQWTRAHCLHYKRHTQSIKRNITNVAVKRFKLQRSVLHSTTDV